MGETTVRKSVDVYVSATGNGFMADIAAWLVEAARLDGRHAQLVTDRMPDDPAVINLVVAPHEFFSLLDAPLDRINEAAAISVPVATEQPGAQWFHIAASYCRPSRLTLDINPHGVEALQRENIPAARLALGGTPAMVAPAVDRDIDVLFLGGDTRRRRERLATLAPVLAEHRSELRLFDFAAPVYGTTPGVVFGDDKYRLLARSRILVNVHRDGRSPGYFEWARMVEAMANGCTVVTEPCTGYAPLEPGVHFVETEDLAGAVSELLADPDRCTAIGDTARRAVLDEHPLVEQLSPLLARLDALDLTVTSRTDQRRIRRNRIPAPRRPNLLPPFRPAMGMRERTYAAIVGEVAMRREIDALRCQARWGQPGHVIEYASPAYLQSFADGTVPEISALVTLHNYAGLVTETLDSIVASRDVDLEIVIVDDHSNDDGREVVQQYMSDHAEVPILLLGREDNHGLVAARNLGVERCRSELVMVMDADNLVYPACLRRLADALGRDPDAAFAYCILEAFGTDPGLRSHLPWNPAWLCAANYIDAQAMVRRSTFERHHGYRGDDDFIYGWEDWDLWLRVAAAGEHGTFVPEMLGRYRTQTASMVSITNLASDFLRERIEARYPSLPWRKH